MNSTSPAPVELQKPTLKGKRLLVVDDDLELLTAVSKVLRNAGADVKSAGGVVEGIAFLAERKAVFDAVLTDLRMPVASGSSILSLMKTTYPNVPVLVMSAYWTEAMKERCTLMGADLFLDKPLHAAQLLETISKAISGATLGKDDPV
jgi:DNA-binding NtrC family response regulator